MFHRVAQIDEYLARFLLGIDPDQQVAVLVLDGGHEVLVLLQPFLHVRVTVFRLLYQPLQHILDDVFVQEQVVVFTVHWVESPLLYLFID